MKVYRKEQIQAVVDIPAILEEIEKGLIFFYLMLLAST